jgi:ketosteroid isomerase-like protein
VPAVGLAKQRQRPPRSHAAGQSNPQFVLEAVRPAQLALPQTAVEVALGSLAEGRSVHGRSHTRAAVSPIFARQPHLTSVVVKTLRAGDLALTHAMWELIITATDGSRVQQAGHGTIVSQRGPDSTWRIVIDDPLSQSEAAASASDTAWEGGAAAGRGATT